MKASSRRWIGPLVLAVGLVTSQTTTAWAAASPRALDLGPGATVFDVSHSALLPLFASDTRNLIVSGHRVEGGGCTFSTKLKGRLGQPAQGEVFLGVNNSTCVALVKRGHLVQLPDRTAKQLAAANAHKHPGGDPCKNGSNEWYQDDPIHIDVNSTTTLLSWCYLTSSSITSCSSSDDYSWYTYTGWYLMYGPTHGAYQPNAAVCDGWTYMEVGNDTFWLPNCGTAHARTLYDYNEFRGDDLGNYWDVSYVTTWGNCSNNLHFEHVMYAS
jgi:hypothetical protein